MIGRIFDIVVLVAYPAIVILGLFHLGPRYTGLLLLLLLGRRLVSLISGDKSLSRIILVQASATTAIVGGAALVNSALLLRIAPLVICLTVIAQFAVSLRSTPIIERFARLQRPDLPDDHVIYCRKLTRIWVGVLAINATVLAAAIPLESDWHWGLIVGPIGYGYLGVVFAVEYLYRKWRFEEFDSKNPVDRLLRPILLQKKTA